MKNSIQLKKYISTKSTLDNVSEGRWAKEKGQENGICLKGDASHGHTGATELGARVVPYFYLPGFELGRLSRAEAVD